MTLFKKYLNIFFSILIVVLCCLWISTTYDESLNWAGFITWLKSRDTWANFEPFIILFTIVSAWLIMPSNTKESQPNRQNTQSSHGDASPNVQHSGSGNTHNSEVKGTQFNQQGQRVYGGQQNAETIIKAEIINIHGEQKNLPKALSSAIPKLNNPDTFIGRDKEISKLRQSLNSDQRVVVVNGLGGIGKTSLAQAYLTKYWDDYQHIIWLRSNENSSFVQDLVNTPGLLDNLGLIHSNELQQNFNQIINGLHALKQQPNLLVIDDAQQELTQWHAHLPKAPQWHVLLTSRNHLQGFTEQSLDFLSDAHALALFKQYYTLGEFSDVQIQQLIELVDRHTLTIELLAKTAQRHFANLEKIRTAIEADLKAGVYINHNQQQQKIERVRSYLSSIFKAENLSEDEQWLLRHFVCLPADYHNVHLLKELIQPAASDREESFSESLMLLKDKGWLLYDKQNQAFKLHSIIARVVQEQAPPSLESSVVLIQQVCTKLYYDESKENPNITFPWVSFGQRLVEVFQKNCHRDYAKLLDNLGTALRIQANVSAAIDCHKQALASNIETFGKDHHRVAISRTNLGGAWSAKGDYDKAIECYEQAFASNLKSFGESHHELATSLNNLGEAWSEKGYYDKAIGYYEQALAIDLETLGEDHPHVAIDRSNLGKVWHDKGDYNKAIDYYEKALVSDLETFGVDHPKLAIRLNNIGLAFSNIGDYVKAIACLEQALAIDLKNFDENHPTVANILHNLGSVWNAKGDYDRAIAYYEQALDNSLKNFGKDHPTVARCLNSLGFAWQEKGDYGKAIAYYEKALASDLKTFGEGHPSVIKCRHNLGCAYYAVQNYTNALRQLEQAYIFVVKSLGDHHPNTQTVLGWLNKCQAKLSENKSK